MKRWMIRRKQLAVRACAALLCGCICYTAATKTIPLFSPFLERMALFSAAVTFGGGGQEAVYAEGSGTVAGSTVETDKSGVTSTPESNLAESSESSAESSAALEKPENAGVVKRQTYGAGTSSVYIPLSAGYIKNGTKLSADTIQKTVSQKPSFEILADGKTPEVLIMHTHATESYQPGIYDWYDKAGATRNQDTAQNTCRVGDEIAAQLTAAGIGVIHDKTLHDYPSYNGAYERSAETVKKYLKQYPSIKVVLDVHRDAIQPDDNTIIAPATTINGKPCAQVMIISGADDGTMNMPHYLENLKFSAALQVQMETDYPTLTRPVMFSYRKYNQDLTTGSILLEMGGHANSLDEAIYCGELVGKSLAKTLLNLKKNG